MRKLSSLFLLAPLGLLSLDCGGDSTGPTGHEPSAGLTVVAGASVADTISATLSQALTVEVRDSTGRLLPGVAVRFEGLTATNAGGATRGTVLVEPVAANQFSSVAAPTTDSQGRAAVLVQFGGIAGPASIAVSVPTLGYADTASFTVNPGNAVALLFSPADTGVSVGGTVQLHARAVDRFRNPRSDVVTYDIGTATAATVTPTGLVTGATVGQVTVRGRAGVWTDSGTVEVVPKGTIAAFRSASFAPGDSSGIVTFNLDGSGYQWLAREGTIQEGSVAPTGIDAPTWAGSNSVIYVGGAAAPARLYTVTPGSAPVPLTTDFPAGINAEAYPAFSEAVGKTFYSARLVTTESWRLWSRAGDGTLSMIDAEPPGVWEWRASPSPAGTKLAYVTPGATSIAPVIKVYDIVTGVTSSWSVPGQDPSWSPAGDRIALVPEGGGSLRVVNADGSNQHVLSGSYFLEARATWSPDAAWILIKDGTHALDLVNTATGTAIALEYLSRYYNPDWKR